MLHAVKEPLFGMIIVIERNIVVADVVKLLDKPEEQRWLVKIVLLECDKSDTFARIDEEQPFRPLIISFVICKVGGYFYWVWCQGSKPFWVK